MAAVALDRAPGLGPSCGARPSLRRKRALPGKVGSGDAAGGCSRHLRPAPAAGNEITIRLAGTAPAVLGSAPMSAGIAPPMCLTGVTVGTWQPAPSGPAFPAAPVPGVSRAHRNSRAWHYQAADCHCWPPRLAGLGLGVGLACSFGPGLRRGFLLSYDMAIEARSRSPRRCSAGPRPAEGGAQRRGAGRGVPHRARRHRAEACAAVDLRAGLRGRGGPAEREHWFARLAAGVFYAWNRSWPSGC